MLELFSYCTLRVHGHWTVARDFYTHKIAGDRIKSQSVTILEVLQKLRVELHCKNFSYYFPVPSRDVTDRTLSDGEQINKRNHSLSGKVWLGTFRLGTGKSLTFFTVHYSYTYTVTRLPQHTSLPSAGNTQGVMYIFGVLIQFYESASHINIIFRSG